MYDHFFRRRKFNDESVLLQIKGIDKDKHVFYFTKKKQKKENSEQI